MRATEEVKRGAVGGQADMFPFVRTYFQTIATATVAKSALEARALGYLRPADVVIRTRTKCCTSRSAQARALAEAATGRRCPRAIPGRRARPASRR